MSQTRHKYTPDEMGEHEFLTRFVARTEIFNRIVADIASADYSAPQQHYLIIGQRGQGKTTLLRRIKIEVLQDRRLSERLIPVKFSEEQYQIRSLVRLWEEVADTLHDEYPALFPDLLDRMETRSEKDDYETACFACLDEAVRHADKKILLLIDNIDRLFDKLSLKEQQTLREILTVSPSYRIIGASTKMLEHQFDYGKPFYEFFRLEKLTGLTKQETLDLLRALTGNADKGKIETIISRNPERIELLRRLTGGVPRTMVILFDIFLDDSGNAFQDLLKVLDEVTPLYKHRMDDLPAQLQDIMHTVAMNWDGLAVKEIAKKTRLESKGVSAQLNQLEKNGIVISEAIGKNKVYQVKERFFNIWYLMRFGRKKDRQRVEWLVKFLESWCTILYTQAREPEKALKSISTDIAQRKNVHNTHTYAVTQLWNELFPESHATFTGWLETYKEAIDRRSDVTEYLTLLLAKKQYHRAKILFELPEHQMKERYKPVWYALTRLMGDEMKAEAAKMGSELEESVGEILARVKEYQEKYH